MTSPFEKEALLRQVELTQISYLEAMSDIFRSMESLRQFNANNKYTELGRILSKIETSAQVAQACLPILQMHK